MEPPLVYKPRQSSAPRQSASPNKSPCSIDPQFPTAAARTMTLKKRLTADFRVWSWSAPFPALPAPVPVCTDAKPAPERFARLRRLSLAFAFVGPARHRRGRRFPSASGFGRFPPCVGERKTLTNLLTL